MSRKRDAGASAPAPSAKAARVGSAATRTHARSEGSSSSSSSDDEQESQVPPPVAAAPAAGTSERKVRRFVPSSDAAKAAVAAAAAAAPTSALSEKVSAIVMAAQQKAKQDEERQAKMDRMDAEMAALKESKKAAEERMRQKAGGYKELNMANLSGAGQEEADGEGVVAAVTAARHATAGSISGASTPSATSAPADASLEQHSHTFFSMIHPGRSQRPLFRLSPSFPLLKSAALLACDSEVGSILLALDFDDAESHTTLPVSPEVEDNEIIMHFLRDLPDMWNKGKLSVQARKCVRKLLWQLASYSNVAAVATRAATIMQELLYEDLRRQQTQQDAGGCTGGARACRRSNANLLQPLFMQPWFDPSGASPLFPQLTTRAFPYPSLASSSAAAAAAAASSDAQASPAEWLPTYGDFVDVCVAYGADVPRPAEVVDMDEDEGAAAKEHCAHLEALGTAIAAEAAHAVAASSPLSAIAASQFEHNFSLMLQCYSLHLSLFPHTLLFRSLCERHDCIVLLLRLLRDGWGRSHQDHVPLLSKIFMKTLLQYGRDVAVADDDGAQGVEEAKADGRVLAASKSSSDPSPLAHLSEDEYFTLCSLFLSPQLEASAEELTRMLAALSLVDEDVHLRAIILTCTFALAKQAVEPKQSLSRALLQRVISFSDFDALRTHPTVQDILQKGKLKADATGEHVAIVHRVVLCGSLLFGSSDSASPSFAPSAVSFVAFLDLVRQGLGRAPPSERAPSRALRDFVLVQSNFTRTLGRVHAKMQFEENRKSIAGYTAPAVPTTDAKQTTLAFSVAAKPTPAAPAEAE